MFGQLILPPTVLPLSHEISGIGADRSIGGDWPTRGPRGCFAATCRVEFAIRPMIPRSRSVQRNLIMSELGLKETNERRRLGF